jgi:hypothetical protein
MSLFTLFVISIFMTKKSLPLKKNRKEKVVLLRIAFITAPEKKIPGVNLRSIFSVASTKVEVILGIIDFIT